MILELQNIKKIFKVTKKDYYLALKDISLSFDQGEFVSILGPSGCGKSTLLNVIAGLDKPTSGEMFIEGAPTSKYKNKNWDFYRKNNVGFIFQSFNLINHLSALENIEMPMILVGLSKKVRKQRSMDLLKKVGLEKYASHKPGELSGGQQQRIAIARALANDPDIILADEPTGALDTQTGIEIMQLIQEIAKEKLVIMVTHNKDLAMEYSTRIIKILDGSIIDDSMIKDNRKVKSESLLHKKNKSMPFVQSVRQTLKNMSNKKGRVAITVFAGSIGIFGISLINGLGIGANGFIDAQVANFGNANVLSVSKQTKNDKGDYEFEDLSTKIESYIADNKNIKEYRTAYNVFNGVKVNGETGMFIGQALAPKEEREYIKKFLIGELPKEKFEILINKNMAAEILRGVDAKAGDFEKVIGQKVTYNIPELSALGIPSQIDFIVSGVVTELEFPISMFYFDYDDVANEYKTMILPNQKSYYDTAVAGSNQYELVIDSSLNAEKVIKYVQDKENINPNDLSQMSNLEVLSISSFPTQLKMVFAVVISLLSVVMQAFLVVALVVSSILISIVLFSSILERKVEIGILKAIGARRKDIMRIFTSEALIIGFGAGVFGVIVSYLCVPIMEFAIKEFFNFDFSGYIKLPIGFSIILVIISCIIALIAGFLPAHRATKMQVVDALREE